MGLYEKLLASNYEDARQESDELQARATSAGSRDRKLHDKLTKAQEKTARIKAELDRYMEGQLAKAARAQEIQAAKDELLDGEENTRLERVIELVGNRPDIIAAARNLGGLLGIRRELRRLESNLLSLERVVLLDSGYREGSNDRGLLALTDRRVVHLVAKITGDETTDIALSSIFSVSSDGALADKVIITTADQAIQLTGLAQAKPFAAKLHELMTAPAAEVSAALDELRKAADLRDAGVLSETEFVTVKARLLAR
jgi:hypothetical protein